MVPTIIAQPPFNLDDEGESLIRDLRINGERIPLGTKSRVRKLLIISRIMVDAVEGPPSNADEEEGPPTGAPQQILTHRRP